MRDNIMTPRKQFEAELDTIADTIIKLADGTKDMLIKAVKGLYNQDITQAKEIIKADKRLDKLDQIINDQAILLIAKRSEEHTSELQSRGHLVCRLLLEKKNKKKKEN